MGGGFAAKSGRRHILSKKSEDRGKVPSGRGPAISAVTLWDFSGDKRLHLLTNEERARLAVISSVVRFKKGSTIYRQGERADAVFNIISGVVKSHRSQPDGSEHISAFLFPDDLVGLAEGGRYTNSAEAVTAVTGYRIPTSALKTKLLADPGLEFHVICKLCHELREAQRHAFLLSNHRVLVKVALFLQILWSYQPASEKSTELYVPMTQVDIGHYIGVSPEAVSRAFRALSERKIISIRKRHHVKILNRAKLEGIASERASQDRPRHRTSPR